VSLQVVAVLGRGLVGVDTPVAAADDLGLTRGDGCFEGCRVRRTRSGGGPAGSVGAGPVAELDKLDLHLARMARSAAALDIGFDEVAWRALVGDATAAWAAGSTDGEAAVKLVLTRGRPDYPGVPTGFVTVSPIGDVIHRQRRDGIRVCTLDRGTSADAFAAAPWLMGGVKTLSYVVNMAAQREAARRGDDDALYLSADGWVLESPTSAIVWAVDGALRTVAAGANGILGSTTLALLFTRAAAAGWETVATAARVEDLFAADVVVSVSSVRGPVRVTAIDGRPLSATPPGQRALIDCRELTDFADPVS